MTRLPMIRFILPLAAWLLVYYESLADMVSVWSQSKTYEHGFVILPISLWLAWRKREQIKQTPLSISWFPIALLLLPTLLWMVGKAADVALFEHVSAIFSLQLVIWALIGTPLTKVLFFPIFYLVFCIPFGEELIPFLQEITADIAVFALHLSNIPVYREGLYLAIPNGLFEVAEACSGIRFLISSIALGTLFAYLSFSKWWKIFAFVIFSFIFPIIANGIRAYGIVLIGYLSDMKYATGADHLIYGWVFFAIVIGVIFYIADKFSDKQEAFSKSDSLANQVVKTATKKLAINIAVITLFFIYQWSWNHNLRPDQEVKLASIQLPSHLVEIQSSFWGIKFPNAQQSVLSETIDQRTQVYIAKSQYSKNQKELISHDNLLFDKNSWSLISSSQVKLGPYENVNVSEIVSKGGVNRTMMYWYCINSYCSASRAKTKLMKGLYVVANQPVTTTFTALLVEQFNTLQAEDLINKLNKTTLSGTEL
ncbi:exosortase A [Vibrio alginolyticus]